MRYVGKEKEKESAECFAGRGGIFRLSDGLPNNIARRKERKRKREFARGIQTQEERDFCALQKNRIDRLLAMSKEYNKGQM